MFEDAEIVFASTRQQEIADGALIDVTEMAKGSGFRMPVAMTATAWKTCIAVHPSSSECVGLDESVKLSEFLNSLYWVVHESTESETNMLFEFDFEEHCVLLRIRELKLISGPDDGGKPCLTVMMPDED